MKRLGLILILMMTVTLVSSNKVKQERPKEDLIYSLDNLKQSVMELDSILKHGKIK